jgi:hypothetical protein
MCIAFALIAVGLLRRRTMIYSAILAMGAFVLVIANWGHVLHIADSNVIAFDVQGVVFGKISIGKIGIVALDPSDVCDATHLQSGGEYLLFLENRANQYYVAWHGKGQLKIEDQSVQLPGNPPGTRTSLDRALRSVMKQ